MIKHELELEYYDLLNIEISGYYKDFMKIKKEKTSISYYFSNRIEDWVDYTK